MTKQGLYNMQTGLGTISLFFVLFFYYMNFKLLPEIGIHETNDSLLIITTFLQALSYGSLLIYKYNISSFNKMMIMLDIVPLVFFINISLLFYSISSVYTENIAPYKTAIIYAILIIFVISFIYGFFYGNKRWKSTINEILFDEKNGEIKFYFAFNALSSKSDVSARYIPLFGIIAVITPFIAHTYGHGIILLLAAIILTPIMPIHISSIAVRRYLFSKYITHKHLTIV